MVECDLAKVEVAGSNPVSRSSFCLRSPQSLPLGASNLPVISQQRKLRIL